MLLTDISGQYFKLHSQPLCYYSDKAFKNYKKVRNQILNSVAKRGHRVFTLKADDITAHYLSIVRPGTYIEFDETKLNDFLRKIIYVSTPFEKLTYVQIRSYHMIKKFAKW